MTSYSWVPRRVSFIYSGYWGISRKTFTRIAHITIETCTAMRAFINLENSRLLMCSQFQTDLETEFQVTLDQLRQKTSHCPLQLLVHINTIDTIDSAET